MTHQARGGGQRKSVTGHKEGEVENNSNQAKSNETGRGEERNESIAEGSTNYSLSMA